jgi:hypothetical protein
MTSGEGSNAIGCDGFSRDRLKAPCAPVCPWDEPLELEQEEEQSSCPPVSMLEIGSLALSKRQPEVLGEAVLFQLGLLAVASRAVARHR